MRLALLLLAGLSASLTLAQKPKHHTLPPSSDCDPSLWEHVWSPERLKVLQECLEVTGVIMESHQESDGDIHLLLRPDRADPLLINEENVRQKNGCLVVEVICSGKSKEKKEKEACAYYKNRIHIPKVHEHVKVTGSLVTDLHHGWNEIHPVSKLKTLKKKK